MKTNKLLNLLAVIFLFCGILTITSCSTGGTGTGAETETGTGTTGGETMPDTTGNYIETEEGTGTGNQDDDAGTGSGTRPKTNTNGGMEDNIDSAGRMK